MRDWKAEPPICPYCARASRLVTGAELYRSRPDLGAGRYWYCAPCGAWTGVHSNSPRFAPKGTLANAELRRLRQCVHAAFDPLWRSGAVSREIAYAWLAGELGVDVKRCHIGYFDEAQCRTSLVTLEKSDRPVSA